MTKPHHYGILAGVTTQAAPISAVLARVRALCRSGWARKVRLEAGVTLGEVGRDCGVSESAVHRWETGQRRPRGAEAVRYLEVLESLRRPSG